MQLKVNKILVPIDFSDFSIRALSYAAQVAKPLNAQIELLHVVETYKMNVGPMIDMEDIDHLIQEKIKVKLEELKNDMPELQGLTISSKVVNGKIKSKIVEATAEDDIDLVVMATTGVTGKSSINKQILGSNAHRVIQAAKVPVLIVPDEYTNVEFKDLVLPLDFQKETTQKIGSAIRWAKQYGSTIHVLSVFNFFDEYGHDVEDLKRKQNEVAQMIHDEGIEVKIKSLRYTDVSKAVLDYAEDNDADLIVIMTRQESKLDQIFLGSRARDVITKSIVPVLSLRPEKI